MPLSEFAGGHNLHFFKVNPSYVDPKKAPGFSKLPPPTVGTWVSNALALRHIWASPNLIWGSIALAFYLAFPYDLSPTGTAAQGPLTWAFFAERFPMWFAVTQLYNLFFHVTLYGLGWAERSFIPGRKYNLDKLFHNVFWSSSGVVIWMGFDNVFAYLWATGRLSYMTDAEAFSTPMGMFKFALGFVLVPLWREAHFYFAHRLLHFKPIYYLVHSLHHRNTDIEPFAGLSMHPVEHLYYYACVMPSLMATGASPFHFVWNGIHLLLSPGASHSGWEDHMQSDAYHYMHHRFFECNYSGFGAAALDRFFGTFVDSFAARGEKEGEPVKVRDDAKAHLGVPTFEFLLYIALSAACVGLWAFAACVPGGLARLAPLTPLQIAFICGFGPILVGLPWVGKMGGTGFEAQNAPLVHWAIGSAVCGVPVMWAAYLCLV